jgi:spermidine synthase
MKSEILVPILRPFSYLFDIQLEKTSTPVNENLCLSLRNGRFYLTTNNAIYSHEDHYDVFFDAFQKVGINRLKIVEILILGFGLGSIPVMLEKRFQLLKSYTGVEIDPVIVNWVHKYVLKNLKSPISLKTADAFNFLLTCNKQFDLVCMDVFVDDKIPEQFLTREFVKALARMLKENSLLMWNHLAEINAPDFENSSFYRSILKDIFPNASILSCGANKILLNQSILT